MNGFHEHMDRVVDTNDGLKEWWKVLRYADSDRLTTVALLNIARECLEEVSHLTHADVGEIAERVTRTVTQKNAAYSRRGWDNFYKCQEEFDISVENGLITRMCDKMARIDNLIENEIDPGDERLIDTYMDLAGYAIIFASILNPANDLDSYQYAVADLNEYRSAL